MDIYADITAKTEELRLAMRAKLRVRGKSFDETVRKAGRILPRRQRKQAAVIVKVQEFGGHPKLMKMIDMAAFNKAYSGISEFLEAIDPKEQRRTRLLNMLGLLSFYLLAIVTSFIVWLVWSGNV